MVAVVALLGPLDPRCNATSKDVEESERGEEKEKEKEKRIGEGATNHAWRQEEEEEEVRKAIWPMCGNDGGEGVFLLLLSSFSLHFHHFPVWPSGGGGGV